MSVPLNPVAMVAFLLTIGVPLLLSLDPVTAGVALFGEICLLPALLDWQRMSRRRLVTMLLVLVAGVTTSGLATLLYGRPGGTTLVQWGPVHISENSIWLAGAVALRVAALVLPSVLLFAAISAVQLADALTQRMRLSERFVLGSLAGVRMVELISDDLTQVRHARRARGVAHGGVRVVFPLLVLGLRRAQSLSVAMEARAFDAGIPRTHYRDSPVSWRDAVLVLGGLAIACAAVSLSVETGSWSFVVS